MTELLHQMRDPAQPLLGGGSVGSIPSSFIAPANNPGFKSTSASQPASGDSHGRHSASLLRGSGAPHATPASNLKLAEAVRTAQHDGSPSVVDRRASSSSALSHSSALIGGTRMSGSKSYTSGLNHSAGTVHTPPARNGGASGSSMAAAPAAPALLDISPNNTQFFEVMYVGKIKVSHKRVPFTFIDDALPKFKAYDAQKIKTAAAAAAALSSSSVATSLATSLASSRRVSPQTLVFRKL